VALLRYVTHEVGHNPTPPTLELPAYDGPRVPCTLRGVGPGLRGLLRTLHPGTWVNKPPLGSSVRKGGRGRLARTPAPKVPY
jgi:hypothetical protein